MWPRLALVGTLAACSFTHGASSGGGGGDAMRDSTGPGSDGSGDAMRPPDASIDAALAACPSGYDLHDSSRPLSHYRLVTASNTWTAAEATCEADGGGGSLPAHLIVLDDLAEASWAYGQSSSDIWIGESDRKAEGVFLAVTDQTGFYISPAGNLPPADCALVGPFAVGGGADTAVEGCSNGHQYMCECDVLAADPTHF